MRWQSALVPIAGLLLAWQAVSATATQDKDAEPTETVNLPGRYDEHRFFVRPITKGGVTLEFFTDTGGGLFIVEEVAKKIGLRPEGKNESVSFPEFKPEASVPPPLRSDKKIFVHSLKGDNEFEKVFQNGGLLGQAWFSGRVWTFDYPDKKLLLHPQGARHRPGEASRVTLGFPSDDQGRRKSDFPRITVEVDGEKLDLLFDTGATTNLSPEAVKALDDGRPAARATCFIAAVHFEKWRNAHPNWRVIERADRIGNLREPMIEVPLVTIAEHKVGPVWFTRRENKNFHEFMSQWTDKQVEGALGGNALCHFRITLDYPNAVAHFEIPPAQSK